MSALTTNLRKISRLEIGNCALFICDMQERFRPLIHRFPSVLNRTNLLHESCKILGIPYLVTEQYSKVFGKTVPELALIEGQPVYEKKKFSMLTDEALQAFTSFGKSQVMLCGIEAHACVVQTALDLLEMGYDVHVVCDAVSSQR
jgi:nicotinamidase-related amidase